MMIQDLIRMSTRYTSGRTMEVPYEVDIDLTVSAPSAAEAQEMLSAIGVAMSHAADRELQRLYVQMKAPRL